MDKKQFALDALQPYFKDPSTFGWNTVSKACTNLSPDGKMCVFGKHMMYPDEHNGSAEDILCPDGEAIDQADILKAEFVNILSAGQWQRLQQIHDYAAKFHFTKECVESPTLYNHLIDDMIGQINTLNLFTYEELLTYDEDTTDSNYPEREGN